MMAQPQFRPSIVPDESVNFHRTRGELRLRFEHIPTLNRTVLARCAHDPPLRVVRAFPVAGGAALVHLHNISGGVLGGDRLALHLEVGPGASAQVTTTGATRLYRTEEGMATPICLNNIRVEENGILEYLPDPIIPFAGSRFRQESRIDLAPGAGLFWWETVAPGREARDEVFDYELLHIRLDVTTNGIPVFMERLRLEPHLRALSSPARLGPYRYFSSFCICRIGLEPARWRVLEEELGALVRQESSQAETVWGVSMLPAHGLIIRAVSRSSRLIATGLMNFWRTAKKHLYGQEAVLPRKVY